MRTSESLYIVDHLKFCLFLTTSLSAVFETLLGLIKPVHFYLPAPLSLFGSPRLESNLTGYYLRSYGLWPVTESGSSVLKAAEPISRGQQHE